MDSENGRRQTDGSRNGRAGCNVERMSPRKIRLYAYAMSPYAAKVHCFLLYKGLEFEPFYINPLRVRRDLPVGHQIPVLTIGEESRNDSTPIGLWLDERFPDRPRLLPDSGEDREKLIALDDWVTNSLIPGSFRSYPGDGIDKFLNGWKLSSVMANTARGGLPWTIRVGWPLIVTRVGFVRRMVAQADNGLSVQEAKIKLYEDFLERLGRGPFLTERHTPSMPDLAAYPQFALFYCMAFRGGSDIERYPGLMAWLARMRPYVSGEPPLIPPHVRKRALP